MTRSEILQGLKDILTAADGGNKAIEGCTEESRLREDFGLTSVNILYVVIAVEEMFDMMFDNVGVNSFDTVGDVIDYIEAKKR